MYLQISSAKSESPIKCETSPNIHSVGRMMSKAGDRGRRSKRLEYECQELIPKRVVSAIVVSLNT